MNRQDKRRATRAFVATLGAELQRVPEDEHREAIERTAEDCAKRGIRVGPMPAEAWRSRTMTVQVYPPAPGTSALERISIRRNDLSDAMTWEQVQAIKTAIGRGHATAVEVYPADVDVVNVANMRHLWILPEPPDYAWKARAR